MNRPFSNTTIQDVASAAGVSVATVSRALSSPEKVAKKTRQTVYDAVERCGYIPNEAARNLRMRQTNTIVILIPSIGNPFFANILEGINEVLGQANYHALVAETGKLRQYDIELREYFSKSRCDGIISMEGSIPESLLDTSRHDIPPIVFAGEWPTHTPVIGVRIDNQLGIQLAVQHLYELGHRRIGHITGTRGNTIAEERRNAFISALAHYQLECPSNWFYEAEFSFESGYQAASQWLQPTERPTALCSVADVNAMGFMAGVHRAGVKVPDQLSIIGFDDVDVAAYFIPALSTIHQPRRAMGRAAARRLLAVMNGEAVPAEPLCLTPDLRVRDTTRVYR